MPDVEVRQWSDRLFAAYLVEDGDRFGVFVGTAATRPAALRLGRAVLRQRSENRCDTTGSGGVSGHPNSLTMGKLGLLNSDGPRSVTTPAHLPLTRPGASS
jgi:hypothetical protein